MTVRTNFPFRNNHILRAPGGWFARTTPHYPWGPYEIDVRENYWGTTDLDEIAEWIYDGHDDDDVELFFVYEPIADGPVATEDRTWSEVKSLYR